MVDRCPCCLRAFEKMQDYPLVLVRRVERLLMPEFMDQFSEEGARLEVQLYHEGERDPRIGFGQPASTAPQRWPKPMSQKRCSNLGASWRVARDRNCPRMNWFPI